MDTQCCFSNPTKTAEDHTDIGLKRQSEVASTIDNEQVKSTTPANTIITPKQSHLETICFNDTDILDIIGKILLCVAEISKKHFFWHQHLTERA